MVLILAVETGTQCVVTSIKLKILNNFLNRISSHVSHINITIQCKTRTEITRFSYVTDNDQLNQTLEQKLPNVKVYNPR